MLVDLDPAALVERHREVGEARVGLHPGGPDHGPGRHALAGGEPNRVGADLLELGPEADLDPAAAQLGDRVVGELPVDLGQHPVHRLDQDPAHPVEARTRIAVHRVGREVLELGERLEARVAAADEDVGEELLAPGGILAGVGHLEGLDDVVAEPDRVREPLEADRVLVEAGHGDRARDGADREHQLVVAELLGLAVVAAQLDGAGGGVVRVDRSEPQVRAAEDLAQRGDDVAGLEQAGGRLGQERRVEHEVDVVDEREPRRLHRQQPLQVARAGRPREPTTGDDDVPGHAPQYAAIRETL